MKQLLFFIPVFLLFISSFGQCDIAVVDSNICVNSFLQVSVDTSGKTISSVNWDFGNGTTSTGKTTKASFQDPGSYKISCIVNFADGSVCQSDQHIQVYALPSADFSIDSGSEYCLNTNNICLTDRSTTISGNSLIKRHFIWGNGAIDFNQPLKSLCHSYDGKRLNFEVGIEVFDTFGCSDTSFQSLRLYPHAQAELKLSTLKESCKQGTYDISITTSPSTTVTKTEWQINGQVIPISDKDQFTASINFDSIYTVEVTNIYGCKSFDTLELRRVFSNLPDDAMLVKDSVCLWDSIDVHIPLNGVINNDSFEVYIVTNQNNVSDYRIIHLNEDVDTVKLKLKPTFLGEQSVVISSLNPLRKSCEYNISLPFIVRGPIARSWLENSNQCVPRDTVFFEDSSRYFANSNHIGYSWNFGDKETSNSETYSVYNPYKHTARSDLKNTRHFYQKLGCFNGTLTVTDSVYGCTDVVDFIVSTKSVGGFAFEVINPSSTYCETDGIDINVTEVYDNYSSINPAHKLEGTCHSTSITAKNTVFIEGDDITTVGIKRLNFKTTLSCDWDSLTAQSIDDKSYYYALGADTPTYISPNVCRLIDTVLKPVKVGLTPMFTFSKVETSILSCDSIRLGMRLRTLDSINMFEINLPGKNPIVVNYSTMKMVDTVLYQNLDTGEHEILASVFSDCECSSSDGFTIKEGLRIYPEFQSICSGDKINALYNATYLDTFRKFTGNQQLENVQWQLNNSGWYSDLEDITPPQNPGPAVLRMAYSDYSGNCRDTFTLDTQSQKVTASFTSSHQENYCRKLVEFYDESTTSTDLEIEKWEWHLADTTYSTLKNPFKRFKKKGEYLIKLKVTSPGGCTDSTLRTIQLAGPEPAYEIISDTIGCYPFAPVLRNKSKNATEFIWEWRDDQGALSNSTDANGTITHIYEKPGIYYPLLRAFDTVFVKDNYYVCSEYYPDTAYGHKQWQVIVLDSFDLAFNVPDYVCAGQTIYLRSDSSSENLEFYYFTNESLTQYEYPKDNEYNLKSNTGEVEFTFFANSTRPGFPSCSDTFKATAKIENPQISFEYCIVPSKDKDKFSKTLRLIDNSKEIQSKYWNLDGLNSGQTDDTLIVSFDESSSQGKVCLTVFNERGCRSDSCAEITFPYLNTYNVFTPNGDNYNENFFFEHEGLTGYKLEIYNRWGECVYNSSSPEGHSELGWNGKFMNVGNPLPESTYFYIAIFEDETCSDLTTEESKEPTCINGTVALIRSR